jgi:hypothetical protein
MGFWMVIISTIPWGLDGDNKHHAMGFWVVIISTISWGFGW